MFELRDAVTGAEEAFNAMSEEMGDNVQGALNRLSSTIEGVVLRFYESKGILRDLIDLVTLMVEGVGGMIDMFNKWGCCHLYRYRLFGFSTTGGLKIATMWHARFKTATLASVVAEKAHAVQLYISRAATLAYAAAQALLHLNIKTIPPPLSVNEDRTFEESIYGPARVTRGSRCCYLPACKEDGTGFGGDEGPPGSRKKVNEEYASQEAKIKTSCSCYQ